MKAIGNYAPGMLPSKEAKAAGYSEVIYLDAENHQYIEEVGAANFFCFERKYSIHSRINWHNSSRNYKGIQLFNLQDTRATRLLKQKLMRILQWKRMKRSVVALRQ